MARRRKGRKRVTRAQKAEALDLRQQPHRTEVPPVVAKRMESMSERDAKDPRAGTAIGILLLRGDIDARQHEAGERYGALRHAWQRMAGCQPRGSHPAGQGSETDPEQWRRCCDQIAAIHAGVRTCEAAAFVLAAIESICVEDVMPPVFAPACQLAVAAQRGVRLRQIRNGLDVIADFYRLQARREEAA